jgi:hypothetical protein
MEEVTGSIPVRSTNQFRHLAAPPFCDGDRPRYQRSRFRPTACSPPQECRRTGGRCGRHFLNPGSEGLAGVRRFSFPVSKREKSRKTRAPRALFNQPCLLILVREMDGDDCGCIHQKDFRLISLPQSASGTFPECMEYRKTRRLHRMWSSQWSRSAGRLGLQTWFLSCGTSSFSVFAFAIVKEQVRQNE